MNNLRISLAASALTLSLMAWSAVPIEYNAAVRNAQGNVVAGATVSFRLAVTDAPSGGNTLYSEAHSALTDAAGMATLMIGEGQPLEGSYETIGWDEPRYLSVSVDPAGGSSYRSLGTLQLLGAPVAQQAATASALTRTDAFGSVWQLTVSNVGDLAWRQVSAPTEPAYDPEKVPADLFFIGTAMGWDVMQAAQMQKLSDTRFAIDRQLTAGEIFKFVKEKYWGSLDWSATSSSVGTAVPMREMGNTPAFAGPDGDYRITVDFFTFTMTITPL